MIREIRFSNTQPLQFGSYVLVQLIVTVGGVTVTNEYINFDANKFAVVYDTQNPNIVIFHFGKVQQVVSNGDYNQFGYSTLPAGTIIELAQNLVTDIAQFTT